MLCLSPALSKHVVAMGELILILGEDWESLPWLLEGVCSLFCLNNYGTIHFYYYACGILLILIQQPMQLQYTACHY